MSTHIHLYKNNPTAGLSNGTAISTGDNSAPLSFTLDATQSEVGAAKVGVRCDSGYCVSGGTSIYLEGTNANKWQLAADNSYASAAEALSQGVWGYSLSLSGVSSTNSVFWVKATSTLGEDPQNDRSVSLVAEGLVAAVE